MSRPNFILTSVLLALTGVGVYLGYDRFVRSAGVHPCRVEAGHREVVFLLPATSTDSWERLAASIKLLHKDWAKYHGDLPPLHLNLNNAFLEETAGIAEIGLWFEGLENQKLWIRWYKLSGETDSNRWLKELSQRDPPPLAIVGGDTSHRCLVQAKALESLRSTWRGKPPLYLVTTATADRYDPRDQPLGFLEDDKKRNLMEVYPGRTFRFCFTNGNMAQTVVDFVRRHPQVWPTFETDPLLIATLAAQRDPLGVLGTLAHAGHLKPFSLYSLAWNDDLYSLDLSDRFTSIFVNDFFQGEFDTASEHCSNNFVFYSVGDPFQPNPSEELTLDLYINELGRFRDSHQLLVAPTGTQRMRRFLRSLCRRAPQDVRNLVVASGDAITFNAIYRDRDTSWNILDIPLPLVFFSHRNPVDASAGFGQWDETLGRNVATGTQDLLLYRDIVEALLLCSFQERAWLDDADRVRDNLKELDWCKGRLCFRNESEDRPLFDKIGNRQPRTGEHVVWLQPIVVDGRNLAQANITIWSPRSPGWRMVADPLFVQYNRAAADGAMEP